MQRKKLTLLWNLLLGTLCCLACLVIAPKVINQFNSLDQLPEGALKTRARMVGVQGAGVLVLICTAAFSFSSVFWTRQSYRWRTLFAFILAVLLIGAGLAISADHADLSFVNYTDYAAFISSAAVICLPIICIGRGYPALLYAAFLHLRKRRTKA